MLRTFGASLSIFKLNLLTALFKTIGRPSKNTRTTESEFEFLLEPGDQYSVLSTQLRVSSQQALVCRGLVMRMLENAGAANLDATVCVLVSLSGNVPR